MLVKEIYRILDLQNVEVLKINNVKTSALKLSTNNSECARLEIITTTKNILITDFVHFNNNDIVLPNNAMYTAIELNFITKEENDYE